LEVQVKRETRSYFWALIAVIVKVSSNRSGSDIVRLRLAAMRFLGDQRKRMAAVQSLCEFPAIRDVEVAGRVESGGR
jgi:hypothetical protein